MTNFRLLFIEGNRQKLDKANVEVCYQKIKALGFIESMPIEYVSMDKAKEKLGDRKLFKVTVRRKSGEGEAVFSNFEIKIETVNPEEYANYDGVCIDGQHRYLALQISDLKEVEAKYTEVSIPETMDILSYIAIRNNGKTWSNDDFYNSGIATGEEKIDYMLELCKEYKAAFIFALYTFGTVNLTSTQIKAIQLGYKKASDFKNLQLSNATQEIGDKLLEALKNNSFLSKDRFTGRFAGGLKKYYAEVGKDEEKVLEVINKIDKDSWEAHFTPTNGTSMEIKSYVEAFKALQAESEDMAA